jgi:hypothetical protein
MRKIWYPLFFLVFAFSCIDPFALKTGNQSEVLVVDGLITNFSEQNQVKLSRSLSFDNSRIPPAYVVPERNAIVLVKDDAGNEILMTETEAGVYKALEPFEGVPGRTYTLQIQTSDGIQYRSAPETMPTVPEIDSVIYEYHAYEELIQNSQGNYYTDTRFGFKISVQVNDPVSERNFYRWKISGIFEFFSFIGETLLQCWAPIDRLETSLRIQNDVYHDGNNFQEVLAIVPYDRPTYYLVTVQQQSLTAEAYRFWNEVRNQQTNTGSIFDPIPSQIRGNVFNVNDSDELVMGFFGASSVVEKSALIRRFHASGFVAPSPNKEPLQGNCLEHEPNATNIKPPGFP